MSETAEKPAPVRKTIDKRLRAARLRTAKARAYIEELGGEDAVAPTARTLVARLTTLDLVISRLEDRLALGQPVDLVELTTLINSQRLLVKAVRETVADTKDCGAHPSIWGMPAEDALAIARQRMENMRDGLHPLTGESDPMPAQQIAPALPPDEAADDPTPITFPEPPSTTEH